MSLGQQIVASKDIAEALSYWATAAGIVVAIVAGLFSLREARLDRWHNRQMRAREIYDDYLKISMDHPEYFVRFWTRDDLTPEEREKYVAFVSYMLNGVEDILLFDGSEEWRESLKGDLRFHQDYLRSEHFSKLVDGYFSPTKRIIQEVALEPDFEVSYA